MAVTFTITDGSITTDLNSATEFAVLVSDWFPKTPQDDNNLHEVVTEDIGVVLNASSIDNMGAQLQKLKKLFRKAREYHETTWQTTPVYLTIQATAESNPSYALVHSGIINETKTRLDQTVAAEPFVMDGIQLLIEREHWTDKVPGAYPSAETLTRINATRPASPTRVHIGNTFDAVDVPTYIFNDDGGVFNDISGSSSDPLFSDAGNIQAGDILYLGFDNPGHVVVMDLAHSAGVDILVTYQYGSGLTTASIANGKLKLFPKDGSIWVATAGPSVVAIGLQASDWDTSAINGQTAYWIKITVNAVNTAGTVTLQNNQPYCPNVNYIDIPNTVTDGDLSPYLHLSLASGEGAGLPAFSANSRIIMALNSQNVTLYDSIIPSRDLSPNADNWAYTNGTDADDDDDEPRAPGGKAVTVDFAGDETLVNRLQIHGSANNVDKAYYGKFRAFIVCEQVSGAAGDLSVQLETVLGPSASDPIGHILTEEKDLQAFDQGAEVVDLGIIDIPGTGFVANDDIDNNAIFFRIFAARSTGASTLIIYSVVLMKTNEWLGVLNSPIIATDNKSASLNEDMTLEMDSGVVRKRVLRAYNVDRMTTLANNQIVGTWELHGGFPKFLPATQYYMHFFIMRYDIAAFGTGPFYADVGSHLVAEVRVTDRYGTIRGAD